ncbi:hypothetical protein QUA62_26945 [Microcoleus sp. MON1_C1]|uniref:hypothetical protein n=1 Tax=Microcoleus sp. MON1_C1 TaxID=2818827 RepID=UPI002FD325D4
MSHLVSRNTRPIGGVTVGATLLGSLRASSLPSCSGSIARSQNSDTTHRVKKSSNLGCNSILPGLGNFRQGLSKSNKILTKFREVSAPTFEAIGGAV